MEFESIFIEDYYGQVLCLGDGTSVVVGVPFVDPGRKRTRSIFGENGVVHTTFMIKAMKAVDVAIINAYPPDVHQLLLHHHGCRWVQPRDSDGGSEPPLRKQGAWKCLCSMAEDHREL
jgi:hypothetical protein